MRHSSDGIAIDQLALAILHSHEGIVLVQQQHSAGSSPYWVVPGGLVEAGELVIDALMREVREEAGVEIDALARLVCVSQIDRPQHQAQTIAFIFELEAWHGTLAVKDPDREVLEVALVPRREAIERLQRNGGWRGIQEPLLAYLHGDRNAGGMWFYRDTGDGQHLVTHVHH
ncbi:MAG: NUDIX hydrolase [Chloroflexota bacterium]|nr:NUDIX hydrolase [Chloroflexota bacterium]